MLISRYHGRPAALGLTARIFRFDTSNRPNASHHWATAATQEYPSTEQLGEALRTGEVIDIEQGWFGNHFPCPTQLRRRGD